MNRADYPSVVIIGGGPAGLTAAYELVKEGIRPVVLEKGDKVGGLARTETYKGFRFDLGGHRFFTKSKEVMRTWDMILGKDLLVRPRLSRIYYGRKFFYYPLRPFNVLHKLGILESTYIMLSYLGSQALPYRREETFEQWVTNRFGRRLFQTFFKSYTEKIWGIPCSKLKAEWAAQRIKDLSLKTALLAMLVNQKKTIATLIEEFHYPRLGPGMMWNAVQDHVENAGGTVKLNAEVIGIARAGNRIEKVLVSCAGREESIAGTHFISSMPITEFISKLQPPSLSLSQTAQKLSYRDFLTVCLVVDRPELFPDNWIYVHDPEVKVGRIQNFKNWSPDMVADPNKTSLGLEYFCTEGDELWKMADADLIELGKQEVEQIGLARSADVQDGCVFRVPKAYPVYDSDYRDHLSVLREFVDGLENCWSIGRNGLHRYNNQDHAMLTGMLAVRNVLYGENHDLWSVNTDLEYHEEIREESGVPAEDVAGIVQETLGTVFLRLDRLALGLSLGTVAGVFLCVATLILVLKGGDVIGPNLQLLSQYFPGYRVTLFGSLTGLGYGFVAGLVFGWVVAFVRNAALFFSMAIIHRRTEATYLRRFLEYL